MNGNNNRKANRPTEDNLQICVRTKARSWLLSSNKRKQWRAPLAMSTALRWSGWKIGSWEFWSERSCHGHHKSPSWQWEQRNNSLRKLEKAKFPCRVVVVNFCRKATEKKPPDGKLYKLSWFVHGPRHRVLCSGSLKPPWPSETQWLLKDKTPATTCHSAAIRRICCSITGLPQAVNTSSTLHL